VQNYKWVDKKESGFTLIELMVVIIILGVLAMSIGPKLIGRADDAKIVNAKVQIENFSTALKLYKLDNGSYPSTEQSLQSLVDAPDTGSGSRKWRKGGYLDKGKVPKDPWGSDYVYLSPGTHSDYDLISYGADSSPGGDDIDKDITNWEDEQ
jgi:general secretion pathway protein G